MATRVDPLSDVEQSILRRASAHAADWFPDLGPRPEVRLRRLVERPRAILYGLHVGDDDRGPRVLAKVRRDWPGREDAGVGTGGRPRLVADAPSTSELTALEYSGLKRIHEFVARTDGGFRAVRPLDHLVDENAILMEYVDAVTLRQLVMEQHRFSFRRPTGGGAPGEGVWSRAGEWQRLFQREMSTEGLPARQTSREAIVERFHAYDSYLGDRLGRRAAGDVARAGAELAAGLLPERLPMAVGHGDYAPRNLFVHPGGQVAVFDPMPRWVVPRFEDLARFLVAVRLLGVQVHSRGAAYSGRQLDRWEREVVDGYRAGGDLDRAELHCYQLLVTLDKWSALVGADARGSDTRVRAASAARMRAASAARMRAASAAWASGYVRKEGERLLRVIEDDARRRSRTA